MMRDKNYSSLVVIALFGAALLLSGCPKKVDTAKGMAAPTEKTEEAPVEEEMVEKVPMAGESVQAMMPDDRNVLFDFDKSIIRSDSRPVLEETARYLNGNPNQSLMIEGYCDERGTNSYNLALGERRAKAVKKFLMALGVSGRQLSTISYGEERSLCMGQNETCYAKNRRAHLADQ